VDDDEDSADAEDYEESDNEQDSDIEDYIYKPADLTEPIIAPQTAVDDVPIL